MSMPTDRLTSTRFLAPTRTSRLASSSYANYLKSEHWRAVSRIALTHYGYRCHLCGETDNLQVHHNNYDNMYHETLQDVVVLCPRCHIVATALGMLDDDGTKYNRQELLDAIKFMWSASDGLPDAGEALVKDALCLVIEVASMGGMDLNDAIPQGT